MLLFLSACVCVRVRACVFACLLSLLRGVAGFQAEQ